MRTYSSYKNQVRGFQDVSETVKAVEKIAASMIHFLKIEVARLKEYEACIENELIYLSSFGFEKSHPLLASTDAMGKALVVITGDKGLVGGLWHRILNLFLRRSSEYRSVIIIGGKGRSFLEEERAQILKSFPGFSSIPKQEEIDLVTSSIFEEFKKERFSKVDIIYPEFFSLADQKPVLIPFLPFDFNEKKKINPPPGFIIVEPSVKAIFDRLLQKYIAVCFYKIVLEAKLSEFSARTVAMEHANAKIKDFIRELVHSFRKEHHRLVTQRQIESFTAHKV
jgi:F-type H+-transporting ATPase subunit gamma